MRGVRTWASFYILTRRVFKLKTNGFRRLTYDTATTFDIWMRENGYDPTIVSIDEIIECATLMREDWRRHDITDYTTLHIALGMLALQNGGEV